MMQFEEPAQVLGDDGRYRATIRTGHGDVVVELFNDESPFTANNFAFLASEGFFDDTVVHRVVPGFVVQMGDPTGTGMGGPGYRFGDELDAARRRGYPRGTLAMANAGPDTNGSQFFVTLEDPVDLPPSYTVFGEVVDGMDVVDDIAQQPADGDQAVDPVRIRSVRVDQR
jgi:cyclophilin family peptidyl-prolyl cis-trans isomerase